jgi:hypothetical protein
MIKSLQLGYSKDVIASVSFFIMAYLIYNKHFSLLTISLLCVMCGIIDGIFTIFPKLHCFELDLNKGINSNKRINKV